MAAIVRSAPRPYMGKSKYLVSGMHFQRSSGVLLHPTSLPGPHGIGDFGREAEECAHLLSTSGQATNVHQGTRSVLHPSRRAFLRTTAAMGVGTLLATPSAPTDIVQTDHPLKARTAEEMAQMPTYYVMEKDKGMAETVAPFMPPTDYIAHCKWLTETELGVYVTEYSRTGFNGALQGYRIRRGSDPKTIAEIQTFSSRTINVPSRFIAGKSDWGVCQTPGAVDRMRSSACTRMVGFHLVDHAGHGVQQEQPEVVSTLFLQFLGDYTRI